MNVKPNSFHLQWHLTERCNLKCKHCYTKGHSEELGTKDLFVILEQYVELIKAWGLDKNEKQRKLSLSGGEPLLRKDFFKLLERINRNEENFTSITVMSNGLAINDKVAKKFKDLEISNVQISVDGLEENNDKIRGRGNFRKAMDGVRKLVDNGVPVGMSMTINKDNANDLEGLINSVSNMGVKYFGVSRLVPIGRGKGLKMLDPLETKKLYERIMTLRREWKEKGIRINTHCSDSLWFLEDPNYETHGCSAGYDSFSILANGDVVPCRRLPIKVGNVLENTLFEIWYSSKVLWDIRNRNMINSECRKCEIFEKCYGGSKCIANGYFGSPFAPDPQCWKLFKKPAKNVKFDSDSDGLRLVDGYVEFFNPSGYFRKILTGV